MTSEKANPNSRRVDITSNRAINFEVKAARWLSEGNQHSERGNQAKAEQCYAKAQFWHDKMNKALGNS